MSLAPAEAVEGLSSAVGAPAPVLEAGELAQLLDAYRRLLPQHAADEHLEAVLSDAVAHPGSLLRAQLAWSLGRSLGLVEDRATELAVAIEAFHSASLLFDDLPAMDDAVERRGRPCPHVRWGQGQTMLAALALITRAYGLLWRAIGAAPPRAAADAARLVEECLGVEGILSGQALDLRFAAGPRGAEQVIRVARGKTVSLVRLTVVLPALIAGAPAGTTADLERLADAWGLAYQALDDFKDHAEWRVDTGKSAGRDALLGRPNLVAALGHAAALGRIDAWLDQGSEACRQLASSGIQTRALRGLEERLRRERAALAEWRRCA